MIVGSVLLAYARTRDALLNIQCTGFHAYRDVPSLLPFAGFFLNSGPETVVSVHGIRPCSHLLTLLQSFHFCAGGVKDFTIPWIQHKAPMNLLPARRERGRSPAC